MTEGLFSDDLRVSLTALRDTLIASIEAAEPREVAALAKQLAQVLKDLDGLPGEEKSELDDLQARRDKRRASA